MSGSEDEKGSLVAKPEDPDKVARAKELAQEPDESDAIFKVGSNNLYGGQRVWMQTFVEYFSGHPTVPFQVDGVGRNLFPRILRLLHCLALHSLAPNSKFEFNCRLFLDVFPQLSPTQVGKTLSLFKRMEIFFEIP